MAVKCVPKRMKKYLPSAIISESGQVMTAKSLFLHTCMHKYSVGDKHAQNAERRCVATAFYECQQALLTKESSKPLLMLPQGLTARTASVRTVPRLLSQSQSKIRLILINAVQH